MTLAEIKAGETCNTGTFDHIVFEHLPNGKTVCMLKDFYKRAKFDNDSNDYKKSSIRKMLNTEFLDKLSAEVGAENIIEHTVDLTSDEGNKKYGSVQDKISLPTCEIIRKYHDILEKYNPSSWWLLATPVVVPGWMDCVRVVGNDGILIYGLYDYGGGVRPFYILNSSISVS